jgi:hypothetical protein
MTHRSKPRAAWRLGAIAVALLGAPAAFAAYDPATGTLTLGTGAPQNNQLKVEVGPGAGQVRVTDGLTSAVQTYSGVRAISLNAGAGDDIIEFDINASQSLALNLNSGSGNAIYKIQWKVPPGAAAATSSLAMSSGGGSVQVELAFESEVPTSSFNWTTNFGGGNKLLKSGFAFKPGTTTARKNVNFANLGGGTHQLFMDVDNDAADGRFTLNSGFASEVVYKVVSDAPSARLDVNGIVRGAKQEVDVVSAATRTNLALRGGTANTNTAETKWSLAHLVPGAVSANLDFDTAGFGSKFEGKLTGVGAGLTLAGRLLGSLGNDDIKLETNLVTNTSLLLDCRAGIDIAQAPVVNPLNCESFSR